jgi:mono/diheme cytochrome c family protein
VAGTVARGQLREDAVFHTGRAGAAFVASVPVPVDEALLKRGRERYGIYCTPCHGQSGQGDGLVVQRGFRRPPTFHADRLRTQPDGYLYDVITNGFGTMPDYAAQVTPRDRWAIVAYLRALQISQNATLADVPAERRGELERGPMPPPAAPAPPSGGLAPADSRYGPRPPAGPASPAVPPEHRP